MKRFLILSVTLLMALGLVTMASAAPMTFFDFDGDAAADTSLFVPNVGDIFTADLYITGIDTTYNGLQSMGIQVNFDNTQINVLSVAANGTNWFIPDVVNNRFNNSIGFASIGGGRFGGLTGTILLGTIQFECMGPGVSVLAMAELIPYDTGADPDSFVSPIPPDPAHVYDKEIIYGFASVTQAPIPGTVLLFGSGLVGLLAIRRRKQV